MDLSILEQELPTRDRQEIAKAAEWAKDHAADRPFEKWMHTADVLMIGRRMIMRALHLNGPDGRWYKEGFGRWCELHGFDIYPSATRSNLLFLAEPANRELMEKLRKAMPASERMRINHPDTMAKRVRKMQKIYAAHGGEGADITDEKPRKPSAAHQLAEALAENARLKAMDGSLFDLRKDTPDSIARICGETVGLGKAKSIRKALDAWITNADKIMKAKNSKPAG